ncbi:DUF1192 domain-containing protein [Roseospira goensis]|uniref:Uncharacterized small protein (DUF1192 family) n=1 Tax=Roseospira goensis TaxID=391922 RepID=A0A7W6RYB7_9PROT|nr:DUF1192 domain-containing protein [Roseospira goensis]MBB4285488.1 uncharacterized small protein (DUF1192 family) [Roseospira goensis]
MPIDSDDLDPRPTVARPPALETLSVGDLEAYIAQLEAEIARARAMIDAKGGARAVAESAFRRRETE